MLPPDRFDAGPAPAPPPREAQRSRPATPLHLPASPLCLPLHLPCSYHGCWIEPGPPPACVSLAALSGGAGGEEDEEDDESEEGEESEEEGEEGGAGAARPPSSAALLEASRHSNLGFAPPAAPPAAPSTLFLQLELCHAPSLAQILARERGEALPGVPGAAGVAGAEGAEGVAGAAPAHARWGWVSAAAGGLDAMHRAGWSHNDVKPANLLCYPDGRAKLVDFGLSSRAESQHGVQDGGGEGRGEGRVGRTLHVGGSRPCAEIAAHFISSWVL